jgi:hypothetical protein
LTFNVYNWGPYIGGLFLFSFLRMAKRFNVSIPDSILLEHAELLKRVSLSLLLQEAIRQEARQPRLSLPPFVGEGI